MLSVCFFQENLFKGRNQLIAKKGWLFKGPDSGHESSIMSFTRVSLCVCVCVCVHACVYGGSEHLNIPKILFIHQST